MKNKVECVDCDTFGSVSKEGSSFSAQTETGCSECLLECTIVQQQGQFITGNALDKSMFLCDVCDYYIFHHVVREFQPG